jgi:UDPglucose--hexose-1-phosphate uridylyltransferase
MRRSERQVSQYVFLGFFTNGWSPGKPCLLCEYAQAEMGQPRDEGRVVVFNDHWVALVPWWATWPFEILREYCDEFLVVPSTHSSYIPVLPYRRHIESISQLDQEERDAFADMLSRISRRYDNLFSCSFAYSMGIHQRPVPPNETAQLVAEENDINFAHLHLHFEPPLLRSASVRKFLVG